MSESSTKRLRVVLSEYGKPVATEQLEEDKNEDNAITVSKGGIISGKEFGQDRWTDKDDKLAKELKNATGIEIDALRNGNLRIKANAHVGHVAFSNFDLVIYPKFDYLIKQEGPFATLVRYAFGFEDLKCISEQDSPETFFADILIYWLREAAWNIQRRGPFQMYRKERKDLSIIRGKIDTKMWLRRGGIPSETMPCEFYCRSFDNVLNQTLCAGLRRSVALAKTPKLKNDCRFLADTFALDGVTEKTLDHHLLADAFRGLNRLNAHYDNAIKLIKLLHDGSGGFVFGNQCQEQVRLQRLFLFVMDCWIQYKMLKTCSNNNAMVFLTRCRYQRMNGR